MTESMTFSYAFSPMRLISMIGLIAAMSAAFTYMALTNESWLLVQGILELNPQQAKVFYSLFAVGCAMALVLAIRITLAARRGPHEVVLGEHTAVVPKASAAPGMLAIPYGAITEQTLFTLSGAEQMLSIRSTHGRAALLSSNFESEERFMEFVGVLGERTSISR